MCWECFKDVFEMIYYIFFIFGKNIFRRGVHGKCLACEMFYFEIIYFAEAPAENAPPAKF